MATERSGKPFDPKRMEKLSGIQAFDDLLALSVAEDLMRSRGASAEAIFNLRKQVIYSLLTLHSITPEGEPVWALTPKGFYCERLLQLAIRPKKLS